MDNQFDVIYFNLGKSGESDLSPIQRYNKRLQEQKNTILSKSVTSEKRTESQTINVNLYIGIFFDGTNNSKVQTMLALSDRRKRFYKKYNKVLNKSNIRNFEEMMLKDRRFFQDNKIGTIAELDEIFGSSMEFDLSMEKKIAVENKIESRQTSTNEDLNKRLRTYSNVAILSSLYETPDTENKYHEKADSKDSINHYYSIYVPESGTNDELNFVEKIIDLSDYVLGLCFGGGEFMLSNKCREAIDRIESIIRSFSSKKEIDSINCYFDVFGFGRGAATARAFTHIINPNDNHRGEESKYLNLLFTGSEKQFLKKNSNKVSYKEIRTLGLFDTVSSIGVLREESSYLVGEKILNISKNKEFSEGASIFHDTNVTDFGLYSTDQAKRVLHICALDEFRKNFELVNIDSSIKSSNGIELFIPGCHTDIGGGSKLGLDNPKIINFDEIATKGNIIFLLYVRVNGLIQIMNSLKALSMIIPQLLNPGTLLNTYNNIKTMLKQFYVAVLGLFNIFTGYENTANYNAANGVITPKSKKDKQKDEEKKHSDLYNWVKDSYEAVNTISNNLEKIPASIKKVGASVENLWSKDSCMENIGSLKDLYDSAEGVVKLVETLYDTVKKYYENYIELQNKEDYSEFKGIEKEIDVFVEEEIKEWKKICILYNDAYYMIKLLFKSKREPFITPIEHRRICMYTGEKPYGKINREKIKPMCLKTLKEAGWIPEKLNPVTRKTFFSGRATKKDLVEAEKNGHSVIVDGTKVAFAVRQNILIYKYCKPGYSNLPLKAMYEWVESRDKMFAKYPNNVYPIPDELDYFYQQLSEIVKSKQGKQEYCVPDVYKYKELRNKYLHISMNQQVLSIEDNGLVNGPSFKPIYNNLSEQDKKDLKEKVLFESDNSYLVDSLIARRIYDGSNPSATAGGKELKAYDESKTKWLFD